MTDRVTGTSVDKRIAMPEADSETVHSSIRGAIIGCPNRQTRGLRVHGDSRIPRLLRGKRGDGGHCQAKNNSGE
jgi:hypothetical protein